MSENIVINKKKIPIIEIFGPVIQGEGAMIGKQTSFIRTGGCDYRCTKCDTMYAVDPVQVKLNATYMTDEEIITKFCEDPGLRNTTWVTLSGGNPAMWDFDNIIDKLQELGHLVAIETQGSIYAPWINKCDQITISPKSNGMGDGTEWDTFEKFMTCILDGVWSPDHICIKLPVFNNYDLDFAERIVQVGNWDEVQTYLSLGNEFPPDDKMTARMMDESPDAHALYLLAKYRELVDMIVARPILKDTIFLPQLHVLAFGNKRGK
jgi:7-carboxy-7-deazaguanine synthase